MVFSLTDQDSFNALDAWLEDFQTLAIPNAPVILVGNKTDLKTERTVSDGEARSYAERHNLDYFETSALDATFVEDAFVRLAYRIQEKVTKGEIQGRVLSPPPPQQQVVNKNTNNNSCTNCFH